MSRNKCPGCRADIKDQFACTTCWDRLGDDEEGAGLRLAINQASRQKNWNKLARAMVDAVTWFNEHPVVPRDQVCAELRRQRGITGFTQKAVARAMDWSEPKMQRIEAGEVTVAVNDLRALLAYYGISNEDQTAELVELTRASRRSTSQRSRLGVT